MHAFKATLDAQCEVRCLDWHGYIAGKALSYLHVAFSGPRGCGTTWKKAANGSAARTIS